MSHKRTHFFLPEEMLVAMDKLAGRGKRNSFVVEVLDHEIRRRRLVQMLSDEAPIWKDEDHPELKDGAYAHIRKMRNADDKRAREKLGDWLVPRE